MITILFIHFHLFFLYDKDKPTLEDHSYRSTNNAPTPLYPKRFKLHFQKKTDRHQSICLEFLMKKYCLTSTLPFFPNILVSPDVLTWLATNGNHRKSIEIMWLI